MMKKQIWINLMYGTLLLVGCQRESVWNSERSDEHTIRISTGFRNIEIGGTASRAEQIGTNGPSRFQGRLALVMSERLEKEKAFVGLKEDDELNYFFDDGSSSSYISFKYPITLNPTSGYIYGMAYAPGPTNVNSSFTYSVEDNVDYNVGAGEINGSSYTSVINYKHFLSCIELYMYEIGFNDLFIGQVDVFQKNKGGQNVLIKSFTPSNWNNLRTEPENYSNYAQTKTDTLRMPIEGSELGYSATGISTPYLIYLPEISDITTANPLCIRFNFIDQNGEWIRDRYYIELDSPTKPNRGQYTKGYIYKYQIKVYNYGKITPDFSIAENAEAELIDVDL